MYNLFSNPSFPKPLNFAKHLKKKKTTNSLFYFIHFNTESPLENDCFLRNNPLIDTRKKLFWLYTVNKIIFMGLHQRWKN